MLLCMKEQNQIQFYFNEAFILSVFWNQASLSPVVEASNSLCNWLVAAMFTSQINKTAPIFF